MIGHCKEWEQFFLGIPVILGEIMKLFFSEKLGIKKVAFRTHHGTWLGVNQAGTLYGINHRNEWENFTVVPLGIIGLFS